MTQDTSTAARGVLVWDLPVRLFHWLMVASFAGAWLTAESERWRLVHVTLGYTMAGLVVFRLLWGLFGTRHARFGDFIRGPRKVLAYLKSVLAGKPEHHVGHNPAGAIAIVAMLLLTLATAGFGWATYNDMGGDWLEEAHEVAANLMMAVVIVHLAGVALASLMHRENLVRAMVTGRKQADPAEGVARAWRSVGAMMLAAVLGFWWLQWQDAPAGGAQAQAHVQATAGAGADAVARGKRDDDDD
jgi:cytochrome b